MRIVKLLLVAAALFGVVHEALPTHLRAGEIRVTRSDCHSLTVFITITVYTNSSVGVLMGGEDDILSFGDGSTHLVPETINVVIDPQLGIGRAVYTVSHTYENFGYYTVSYSEPNRNTGILNLGASVNKRFFIESAILLEPGVCNSTAALLSAPVDRACPGTAFYHNPAAADPDGDSLSYELTVPKSDQLTGIAEYVRPNDQKFYTPAGIDYNTANEEKNGQPFVLLNPLDGLITWNAPGMAGEYVIALKIIEWKRRAGGNTWYQAGYTIRDMQIIVEECQNRKPALNLNTDLCVVAGNAVDFTASATDPDNDPVVIEALSDIFSTAENPPHVTPANGVIQSTLPPNDTAAIRFQWTTSCADVRSQPYRIVFKIADRPADGPRLVRFYTVTISVIAPEPSYEAVSVNPVNRKVALRWSDYPCENVEAFQVWRRVASFIYQPSACDTGMPAHVRYELIAELPADASGFEDANIDIGSQYCYRVVALISAARIPSRISADTCVIPRPAEAPVITNVSVSAEDEFVGDITIRWTTPFEIDRQQYPPPYQYQVYRKNAAEPTGTFEQVSQVISDTTFVDNAVDTRVPYRYFVTLFVPALAATPLDTSSQASTVHLVTTPRLNAIELTWSAHTPWSNYVQQHPYHLVYRKTPASDEFVLIDSVDVNQNGFHYVDRGTYHDQPLILNARYAYRVTTRGSYGNPSLPEPLVNRSQVAGGNILDTIPPCPPSVTLVKTPCEEFSCAPDSYYSVLEIHDEDAFCNSDVTGYEILVSAPDGSALSSLGITSSDTFTHSNLTSLDRCYRVVSIDAAGNRSDTTVAVCNTNCLTLKLPNIITPGTPDDKNDYLTAFSDEEAPADCMRNVRQLDLSIFTRTGEEIFTTTINPGESLVFWTGVNNLGQDVGAGTYFYRASVAFETSDGPRQTQELKGWIHVLR